MRNVILSEGFAKAESIVSWTAVGFLSAMLAGLFIYDLPLMPETIIVSFSLTALHQATDIARHYAKDPKDRGPRPLKAAAVIIVTTTGSIIAASPTDLTIKIAGPVLLAGMALIMAGMLLEDRNRSKTGGNTP